MPKKPDFENYPRVTKVCSEILNLDFSRCPQNNLDYGSHVHKLLELYDTKKLDFNSVDDSLMPDLMAWKKFINDYGVVFCGIEKHVWSSKYFYQCR